MVKNVHIYFFLFIFVLTFVFVLVIHRKYLSESKEDFTTPTAANVPAMGNLDGKPFFVGNKKEKKRDTPIVSPFGTTEFRKPQLLYDGIWGQKCALDGKGNEACDWRVEYSNYPLDKEGFSYGANNFWHLPEKKLRMGEEIISPPDCSKNDPINNTGITYLQAFEQNPPIYLCKPTMEDILGFDPNVQDNNLYKYPPVVIGTL